MTRTEEKINAIFERLVPRSGKADTVAGEITRAISRIGYRWLNDGDKLGIEYGRKTCNPAGRFLAKKGDDAIADAVGDAWGVFGDGEYEEKLHTLEEAVLAYLERHPELEQEKNTEDFWDYRDPDEDVDTYEG